MSYINPAPGSVNQITLVIDTVASSTITGNPVTAIAVGNAAITMPALIDMTIKNSNDVHTWSQLDGTAKYQVPTTATNDISMNIVVDPTTFFGANLVSASTDTVTNQGIMGLSRNKTKIAFAVTMANPDGNVGTSNDYVVKGQGYITGLAPTINATAPVWVTPVTITVTGEFLVSHT
jgi:hypothetical protein